jgi:hypothetical protein
MKHQTLAAHEHFNGGPWGIDSSIAAAQHAPLTHVKSASSYAA